MCGISGVYLYNDDASQYEMRVSESIHKISHRGPDAQAVKQFTKCVLGHARLSIIDTSEAANQPFSDELNQYTLVYNGEIYNYQEIKQELIKKGHSFRTSSDTEVLLRSYIEYGAECLNKLNGFFSFAIYDQREHKLFGARDRFGIKPFIYHNSEKGFFFSSEMAGLISLGIEKEIDHNSLFEYLQFNYIPSPTSIFKGVQKLEPGTYFELTKSGMEVNRYYDIANNTFDGTYEDAQEQLRLLLKQSVSRRLVADVPLGTYLSGGIDSSIISMLASNEKEGLKTFSIGYADEPFFDETNYANEVAKHIGSDHEVFKLTNQDLLESLPKVLNSIDEPFADSSALPVHILSQLTRQRVTVALSGDGADELFAGYNKYMGEWMIRKGGWKSRLVDMANPIIQKLPKSRNSKFANRVRQLARFQAGKKMSKAGRYLLWCKFNDEHHAQKLLNDDFNQKIDQLQHTRLNTELTKYIGKSSGINEILLSDINLVLQSDMLHKVDKMSMANSLEVRVPFLDHEVVDFAMSLPEHFKIIKGMKKRILQDAFKNDLPESLYNRPKHGFEVPLLKWLREDLNDRIENEWLADDFVKQQSIFDPTEINRLKAKLKSNNPEDSHATVWALIVFQNWYSRYF